LADVIRDRLASDQYLCRLVPALGISLGRLIAICRAHGIRYSNGWPTDAQIRAAVHAVTVEGLTVRAAAKRAGMSRSAVHRYVTARRRSVVARSGAFQPLSVSAYRCPRHGLVTHSPCVACESLAARGEIAA